MKDLQAIIQQMKAEILADVVAGTVPASVSSFSALHDYVDANTYGGFCDEDRPENVRLFELQEERDSLTEEQERNWSKAGELDELQEQDTNLGNAAQNAIDAWIKSGALNGSDVIQQKIFKLSAIQKQNPPTSKIWQDISNELAPLFEHMRAVVARPVFDSTGLPSDLAATAEWKAARMWCYVTPDGRAFYVTEDEARKMQARSTGQVFPPLK